MWAPLYAEAVSIAGETRRLLRIADSTPRRPMPMLRPRNSRVARRRARRTPGTSESCGDPPDDDPGLAAPPAAAAP